MDLPHIQVHEEYKIQASIYIRKIEFEGHSYIYLHNYWNSAGNTLLHDPGCACHSKGEKKKQE